MANEEQIELYAQAVLYLMNQNVDLTPPSNYENKVAECKKILDNDVSGLVSSIIEFIEDAISDVKFTIETDSSELTKILNLWLSKINDSNRKFMATGIKAFIKQYVREHFTSSLVATKYNFEVFNKFRMPTKLWVLNSEKIKCSTNDDNLTFGYTYKNKPIGQKVLIRREGRLYDNYPVPYLIRRGVWANYKLKKSIKDKSAQTLEQLLWYLFMLKKGNPNNPNYKTPNYTQMGADLKQILQSAKNSIATDSKIPAYMTSQDTEAEHVLPDLSKIFTRVIYEEIDRDILSGMGMIDIVEGVGSTRRDSILNPKPLMQKTISMLIDVEYLIYELIKEIVDNNKNIHRNYFNNLKSIKLIRTPIKAFWSQEFKEMVRSYSDRGLLSLRTSLDSLGFDFETELRRREEEAKNGYDMALYPRVIINREGVGIDLVGEDYEEEETKDEDKKGIEKLNYTLADLEKAPWENVKSLPQNIKKKLAPSVQKIFLKTFNNVYNHYIKDHDKSITEQYAFATAWKMVKKLAKINKKGIYVLKRAISKADLDIENIIEEIKES